MPVQPVQMSQQKSPSFFSKYKFTLITVAVLLLALIPLLVYSKYIKKAQPVAMTTATPPTPTPTVVPLTQQNVQPTLSATSQQIQNALNQTTQDLNSVNQIDSSQDSVAGI